MTPSRLSVLAIIPANFCRSENAASIYQQKILYPFEPSLGICIQ